MGIFDRFKRKPAAPPRAMPGKRYYTAGSLSDVAASWTTKALTADQIVYNNWLTLVARSREQYANNDYARRFVQLCKSHVVGADGFQLQAQTQLRNGEPDMKANEALETGWREWQRARYCDVTGKSAFVDLLRLWIASVPVDGEVFVRRRLMVPETGHFGYALQFVDSVLIDPRHNETLLNGHRIIAGIEYDQNDRTVAYYVGNTPAKPWMSYQPERTVTRVPASEIWHSFIVERVGQKRGIPWFSTPLQRMQMLDGYEEAAVVAARAGAQKAMFYQQGEDAAPSELGLAAPVATGQTENGEFIDDIEPGMVSVMPYGYTLGAYDPTYPHEQFGDFIKANLRGIASGLGVSYHKLAGDLADVNFSSGRLGEQEDRELWRALQNWCVSSFLEPLYEDWLSVQLRLNNLTINGARGPRPLDPEQEDKYRNVRFIGRRWQGIQPKEEADANQVNLANKLTSPQRLLREQGIDPDDLIAEWRQWQDKLATAGLQPVSKADEQTME